MKKIYLDSGASTQVDPEVIEIMQRANEEIYGNASSVHDVGEKAKEELNDARNIIAKSIDAKPKEIIFTSGGTEANNFVVKGIAFANKDKGNHIIITKIEHDCILNSAKWLTKHGFEVTHLDVDGKGFINLEDLENAITDKTILVSIIHGNNEIGTLQDLKSIYQICKKKGVYFHTDACQSYTKADISAKYADLITLNSHKIHGPKGVGALYIKTGVKIDPLMHGGGHEFGYRSGTENVPAIMGFAKAVELSSKKYTKQMTEIRDYMIEELLKIPEVILNGPKGDKRLANNINISFRFIEGESIAAILNSKGICSSTGSACSSSSLEPSHVLMAIDNNPERAHGSIRLTISRFTTKKDIDYALECIQKAVEKLRGISPLTKIFKKNV